MTPQTETKDLTFTVLERAVLYARVSSDDRSKEGRNLQGQLDMGREHTQTKGYSIVAELPEDDRGASGAEIDLPQLNKIREMAQSKQFDVLVVRELDRLSRNLAKQLIIEEELAHAGVRIEYVIDNYEDSPEGRLNKHIKGTIAEFEREKIRERLVRAKRNKAKAGKVLIYSHPPFGYRFKDGKLVVYEPEAAIVRLIFTWYLEESMSSIKIANKLNVMGVPTAKNVIRQNTMGWTPSVIRHMLKNETYSGVWYFGKANTRKNIQNSRDKWIRVDVPAIVSKEAIEAVLKISQRNKEMAQRNRKRYYLLSGRVKCSCCGMAFSGRQAKDNYAYYKPPRVKEEYRRNCSLPYFRADILDTLIWNWLVDLLTDDKQLRKGLEEFKQKTEEYNRPLVEQLEIAKKLLADNQGQLTRLLDLYLSGEFDKEMLIDKKVRLETTIASLDKERAVLTVKLQQELTDQQIEELQDFARKIRGKVKLASDNFEAQRKVLDILNVQVKLTTEEGQRTAYAECSLGEKMLIVTNTIETRPVTTILRLVYGD